MNHLATRRQDNLMRRGAPSAPMIREVTEMSIEPPKPPPNRAASSFVDRQWPPTLADLKPQKCVTLVFYCTETDERLCEVYATESEAVVRILGLLRRLFDVESFEEWDEYCEQQGNEPVEWFIDDAFVHGQEAFEQRELELKDREMFT